ncbi:MAG TPA: tRNA uridine(34) 5-carboxymethylaminomethyl modification radical SAM/GNAT enzyme Elp3, partial [Anaerolineae bacterium]|nr:tRNA uridine(34) 5-carboxymethylaminomethyl modification radical SAM/GNAT enzyme Elp3 [Anaerolineae bacterium]
MTEQALRGAGKYEPIDVARYRVELLAIIEAVRTAPSVDARTLRHILRRHPRDGSGFFSKGQLVAAYRALVEAGDLPFERETFSRLQMKPVRTQSGIAAVAVLTRPAGCPGRCIFCPDDPTMPKSYLAREPGAQRALRHDFDPYQQTRSRLTALYNTGHPIDKVELLILGGTWGAYAHTYGEWFIQRCLDALNGRDSAALHEAQRLNQQAPSRCVGLTIETRPDWVTPDEVMRLRRLGVTRVQLGVQSLDDRILALNGRGHDVEATRRACRLLRAAGFKLHLHWMPNLYGATPESDRADFARLWSDPDLRPDYLKIYPTALLAGTELYELWQQGAYRPYDENTLVELLADCKAQVPAYCRLTRVVRDIPADYILEGSRASNLRETVQKRLAATGRQCRCIRCREVGDGKLNLEAIELRVLRYETGAGLEHFLSMETGDGRLAGFLRLLLPWSDRASERPAELAGCALIRELHVYGPALHIGATGNGETQHRGLGSRLLAAAEQLARDAGWRRIAVIAALGTETYYRRRGFALGDL